MNESLRWLLRAAVVVAGGLGLYPSEPVAAAERQPAIVAPDAVRDPFGPLRSEQFAADSEHWELSGLALETLGSLEGAVYDEEFGTLVLIGPQAGEEGGPYHLDDFVVALRSVLFEKEPIGMTIDPNPDDREGLNRVSYFGGCQDTALGWVMFECDRLLKSYSAGVDNLTGQPLQPDVPDFHSTFDLRSDDEEPTDGTWNRYFLTLDPSNGPTWQDQAAKSSGYQPVVAETANGRAMSIEHYRVHLATQVMRMGAGGRLEPAGVESKKGPRYFANHFTANYAKFAKIEPVFARLEAAGRLLILADWIKKERIPIDLEYLRSYRQQVVVITPTVTPVCKRTEKTTRIEGNRQITEERQSIGGVEFDSRVFFANDTDGKAAGLATQAAKELSARPADVAWSIETAAGAQRYVSIPTRASRFKRKTSPIVAAARLAEGESISGSRSEIRDAHLPPRPPVTTESDRSSSVPPVQVSISNLQQIRKLARGPPGEETYAVLVDERHKPESDRSSVASVEPIALSLLSATARRIRGPPTEADRHAAEPAAPLTTSGPPPAAASSANSDRSSVVGSEPLSLSQLPRPPTAADTAVLAGLLSDLGVDSSVLTVAGSDRSSQLAREVSSLLSLKPLAFQSQARAEVRTVAYSKNSSSTAADLGLPLYSERGGVTLGLPRLFNTSYLRLKQREIAGIAGKPETKVEIPDQVLLASESGDIQVLFGKPEIDQVRVAMYFPPLEPAPPGLVGYYPATMSLVYRDGTSIAFDKAGLPKSARLTDGAKLEFSYAPAASEDTAWPQPLYCSVTRDTTTTTYSLVSTEAASAPATVVKPAPASPPTTTTVAPVKPKIAAAPSPAAAPKPAPTPAATVSATLTSNPPPTQLHRLELTSVPNQGQSVALAPAVQITAAGAPLKWKAVLRDAATGEAAFESVSADGDVVRFAGPGGETLIVAVRPDAGELAAGESVDLKILVGHPAGDVEKAASLETAAKFYVAVEAISSSGNGPQELLSVPVRIDHGSSGGGGIGLAVLLVAASVCIGVFVFVALQNSR